MTIFENYKQKYLNYKEAFDYILNPKNEEYLIEYLGKNETIILKLVFNTFIERLNNHQKGLFHSSSILTADTVKQLTGLSYYLQRKAISRLENYFKIITYNFVFTSGSEHQCRAFEINFENINPLYNSFDEFKYTSSKLKTLNKQQLIQIILNYQDRLSWYFEDEDEEEEELL